MFCEKCGSPIKESAKFCEKCGYRIAVREITKEADVKEGKETGADGQEGRLEGKKGLEAFKNINFSEWKNKLLTGKNRIVIIIAAAVFVVLAVGIGNAASLNNLLHKTFSSPEKYYHYVEKQTTKQLAEFFAEQYDNDFADPLFYVGLFYPRHLLQNGKYDAEVGFRFGEGAEEFLDMLENAGADLSWLKSGSLAAQFGIKDNAVFVSGKVNANQKDILSGNAVVDFEKESLYLQFPELNRKYLGAETSDEYEEIPEQLERMRNIIKNFPDKKQVKKLIEKYGNIAIGCVDDVSLKNGKTLKAEGITQKCTEIKIKIDAETVSSIYEAWLEEAENDKTLQKIVKDICDAEGEIDGEELYEGFLENLEREADYYDRISDEYSNKIEMSVFVDNKGIIRGREVQMYGNSLEVKMPRKGTKYGFSFIVKEGSYQTGSLEGSGKWSGNKLDGTFELKVDNSNILELKMKKFDLQEAKKGRLNGRFEMGLGSGAKQLLTDEMSYYDGVGSVVSRMLSKMSLTVDADSKSDAVQYKVGLQYKEEELLNASCKIKASKSSNINVPKDADVIWVEDMDGLLDYIEEVDSDKLFDVLETIGVPSEYLDILELFLDGGMLMRELGIPSINSYY